MKKRILTLLIVCALLCALPFQAIALTDNEGPDESSDSILLKEIDVDPAIKAYYVQKYITDAGIEIEDEDSVIVSETFIQIIRRVDDDTFQSILISDFDEGGIVNFEDRAKELSRLSYSGYYHSENLSVSSYFTVYNTLTFERAVNSDGYRFYRPIMISLYWLPGNGYTITDMTFFSTYTSHGLLIKSPDCLANNLSYNDLCNLVVYGDPNNILDYYEHLITINRTTALNANTLESGANALASNRAIWFLNAYAHGSSITADFQFKRNGISDNAGYSVDIGRYY